MIIYYIFVSFFYYFNKTNKIIKNIVNNKKITKMNSSNIFNIRMKKTLVTLMSFVPKKRRLQIIQENKCLQNALKVNEIIYQIYSLKNWNIPEEYHLQDFSNDPFTKRQILRSLNDIGNLPFFNNIGFEITGNNTAKHDKRICSIVKLPSINKDDVLIGSFSWDNTLKIWNLTSRKLEYEFTLPLDDIIIGLIPVYTSESVKNRKNPILIILVTWDKEFIVYNLRNKKVHITKQIQQDGKLMCVIRQNDKIITSSYGKEIRVWDIKEIIKLPAFKYPNDNSVEPPIKCFKKFLGHTAPIPSICTLKDGRFATCSWDETIRIWNIHKNSCDNIYEGFGDKLINLIQLFDEKLAVVTYDGCIKIYNMRNKDIESCFQGEDFVYQINDGRLVTLYRDEIFQVINIQNQKTELRFGTPHKDKISSFLQLDDGRFVTSSFDKTIKVYGFVTKKEISSDAEEYEYAYEDECIFINYVGK